MIIIYDFILNTVVVFVFVVNIMKIFLFENFHKVSEMFKYIISD